MSQYEQKKVLKSDKNTVYYITRGIRGLPLTRFGVLFNKMRILQISK